MRKFGQLLFTVLTFLIVTPLFTTVQAQENKYESIHIDIELHDDGSATVRETRQAEMFEDTELYIEMINLQDSELLDFYVDGFTKEEDWDIDDSFEEKANRYGTIDVDDGYELAWGISEYGSQEYLVTYSLSNLVRSLDDGQALFWDFDTFTSLPTDKLTIELRTPFPLEEAVLDYYGFGFEGPLELSDGTLKWTGFGLDSSNNVILLVQFPTGTFSTAISEEMTLEEQMVDATEGSSYNEEEPMPLWAKILITLVGASGLGVGVGAAAYGINFSNIRKRNNHFYPTKYIQENKPFSSEAPPNLAGDIGNYAYFLNKVVYMGGGFSNYFFAYLLIWSFEDKIQIETSEEERFLFGTKTKAKIHINNFEEETTINELSFDDYVDLFEMGECTLEEVVWGILLEVADSNGVIDGKDVQKWSEKNAESISDLVLLLDEISLDWLEQNRYIEKSEEKLWGTKVKIEALTDKGKNTVDEIIQFDNFIRNIKEESLTTFDNWQELIVWAALFGKAEEIVKYIEEFEPTTWAYLEDTYPYVYGHYYGWHSIYTSHSSGMASGGYSDTGGGFSSGGGGAGAGGGGGGGSR